MVELWICMLAVDLLIPLTMIGFGKLCSKKPPKNINHVFGYRTNMSMKNKDTWKFAHEFVGRLWFKLGLILLPLSIIPLIFVFNKDFNEIQGVGLIVCVIQVVVLVGTIIPTESSLKKTFDQNGKRITL